MDLLGVPGMISKGSVDRLFEGDVETVKVEKSLVTGRKYNRILLLPA